jgi:hypothetical protein
MNGDARIVTHCLIIYEKQLTQKDFMYMQPPSEQNQFLSQEATGALLVTAVGRPEGKVLVFHTLDRSMPKKLSTEVLDWCYTNRRASAVQVCDHRSTSLKRQKSFEALRNSFGTGAVEYDPTRLIGKLEELVKLANAIRAALPHAITKIGYESNRRSLYVILDASLQDSTVAQIRAVMLVLTGVLEKWRKSANPELVTSVRVGFIAPTDMALVAVDIASTNHGPWPRLKAVSSSARRLLSIASLVGFGTMAGASEEQTVTQKLTLNAIRAKDVIVSMPSQPDDGQTFWIDPTFSLLGIPEVPKSQMSQQARLVAQAVEWSVNAPQTPREELEPIDIRFYAQGNLIALEGGGYISETKAGPTNPNWSKAFNALLGLSDVNADVALETDGPVLLWLRALLGKRLFAEIQSMPRERSTQGYTA